MFGVIVQAMTNRSNKDGEENAQTTESKMPLISNEPDAPRTSEPVATKERKYKTLKEMNA